MKKELEYSEKRHLNCSTCNEELWEQWEADQADNLLEIKELQKQGHPHHCACRQVWGDGQCECDLYKQGYDPYGWRRNNEGVHYLPHK